MMRNAFRKDFGAAFSVVVIPTLKDNFSYLICDHTSGALAAVDVNSDYKNIIDYLQKHQMLEGSRYRLQTVLSTHKHWDHTGGNVDFRDTMLKHHHHNHSITQDNFVVIGGVTDAIPGVTHPVKEGDALPCGSLQVAVLDAPCHTKGHVLYKVFAPQDPEAGVALFTGDTMFIAGIGAFFEGTASDMCAALKKVYHLNGAQAEALDAKTFIFPGHEYTAGFMKFSESVYPNKADAEYLFIQKQKEVYAAAVAKGDPSVPSSLADEKVQNMFLRVSEEAFRSAMGKGNEVQLMDFLYNACD